MGVAIATIVSEGAKLDSSVELVALEVRRALNRIPEASITVRDGSPAERTFAHSNAPFFELGNRVAILLRYEGETQDFKVFEGLVVRHAVESRPGRSTLRAELKDAAFKLTRRR